MTKEEALAIIELYKRWNTGQQSDHSSEQKLLDERRKLIIKAYQVLGE